MTIKLLAILMSVSLFSLVLELVRRRRLTFKYAMAWLMVSAMAIFFAIFHTVLFQFAAWLGFELPSNFIFFALLSAFVFLSLLLTVFLCQLNERNDRMAQKIGILELELQDLKQRQNI